MEFEIVLISAILLDGILGDPRWFLHPVRVVGWICQKNEQVCRKLIVDEKIAGILTVLLTLAISVLTVIFALLALYQISPQVQLIGLILTLYFFIAVKDLIRHSLLVYEPLQCGTEIERARVAISQIVGRDTENMNETEISRACVETVAENLVDGITAPLFWAIVFSFFAPIASLSYAAMAAVGISAYKTVNTMDSMFGYKNKRYIQFGWAAARLDDLANFIPARITGILLVVTAFVLRFDWRASWKVLLRDRYLHASPNAGHSEAAVAGALGIQLGGTSSYFGEKVEKPTIGDENSTIRAQNILDTNKIVLVCTAIFLVLFLLLRKILFFLL